MLNPSSINISNDASIDITQQRKNFFFNPDADYAKMASSLNSDKVICGVLEEDCRLPEEESSEKETESILVLLERDYRPCRGGKL